MHGVVGDWVHGMVGDWVHGVVEGRVVHEVVGRVVTVRHHRAVVAVVHHVARHVRHGGAACTHQTSQQNCESLEIGRFNAFLLHFSMFFKRRKLNKT